MCVISTAGNDRSFSRDAFAFSYSPIHSRVCACDHLQELDGRVRAARDELRNVRKAFDKTEDDLKALQSMGQIIGEVLRQLDEDRFIVKASSGPRYVVGCRTKLDKSKLVNGTRVTLDMTTLTIMRALPREVDPLVFNMLSESSGFINGNSIDSLNARICSPRPPIEL